jgi:hypothetical protein
MTEKAISILAEKLAKLVEIFRQGGKANDFHWWNENSPRSIFYPLYGYQAGQPLFETVAEGVKKLNPEMLSEHEIKHQLMYHFLQKQTINVTQAEHLYNQDLINEAKTFLGKLIEFKAWQDIDFLIANLHHEGEAAKLGRVTFMTSTKEELGLWKEKASLFWPEEASNVQVIARVRAPGDFKKAISYAREQVDLALDILRAFCFPFGRYSDTWRVGVVGDLSVAWSYTPMRINNKEFPTRIGASLAQIELKKDILSKLEQPQWALIEKLVLKTEDSRNNMETKLLDGIHWLSESTKPDTNNSKFAKISFSLETLIGGEPKDEDLKVRGITAMLAERAAFIAGKNLNDRLAIDKDIRTYYGMRSNIVHGGEGEVSLDNIDGFGQLVRRVALALLEKLDELANELSNVEKLENWVKKQKYTLPDS